MTMRSTVRMSRGYTGDASLAQLLGLSLDEDTEWVADAVCAQTDPDGFYPEKGGATRATKAVCASCPVTQECLEYALQNNERHGVWGGKSENERRALRRRRQAALRDRQQVDSIIPAGIPPTVTPPTGSASVGENGAAA